MSEILSQQEVNTLLSGITTGDIPATHERGAAKEVIPFDFRLPHRLSKNQLRTFRAIHESFAEMFGSYLGGRLQTAVSITVPSVDQLFYSEYVHAINNPSCLYVFRIDQPGAFAVLELSPPLVLAMVEQLMGGTASDAKPSRQITRIEQNIVRSVVIRILVDLQRAWKAAVDLSFVLDRNESEGELVQLAPPSEIVMVVPFEVTIGVRKHPMNVCFPTSALEDVLARLNVQHSGPIASGVKDGPWAEPLLRQLETTRVEVSALLGESMLTLSELLTLEPGDIIRTNIPIDSDVRVCIDGKTRMWGRPGVAHNNMAVKIHRTIREQAAGE